MNLAVDLGQEARIDEIAIRLLGGAPQPSISFPGWIEAFVSRDGQRFSKIVEFSRWHPGDFARFNVPADAGKSWIHCLRFTGLSAQGRWIGLRLYATGLTASDELYVFGAPGGTSAKTDPGAPSGFSVSRPQLYFHKPELVLATNVVGPVPVGVVVPEPSARPIPLEMTLELPSGIQLAAARFGESDSADGKPESLPDGGTRWRIALAARASEKTAGRLYLEAPGWTDGQSGAFRYRFRSGDWESPQVEVPARAVAVPRSPRLERLMLGLGWWSASETAHWPGALDAWTHLGLNTFPLFPGWMKVDDPLWEFADQARRRGFFITTIDSPLHRMLSRHKTKTEIRHQMADGSVSTQMCPSYRGPYYHEEIERFAQGMGRARPDLASVDIELWGWRGPIDSQKCTRCQADFKRSGLGSWDEWYVARGDELWRDLVGAARARVKERGGPEFEIGGYDFRPGAAYQRVWSVDRLCPEWMQSSQVSTYSCLYPYHLVLVGDEARKDRAAQAHGDVCPWLTPGDAGTFPGESFQWALLECYTNGARGIWFWSSRVWDIESMIACIRVVRAIAPVERILTLGRLAGADATVAGPGRVSGMRLGNQMVLLAADYAGRTRGAIRLRLRLPVASELRDLLDGRPAGELPAGERTLELPLEGARARLLHVRPTP